VLSIVSPIVVLYRGVWATWPGRRLVAAEAGRRRRRRAARLADKEKKPA
jgi:hypothetical protein